MLSVFICVHLWLNSLPINRSGCLLFQAADSLAQLGDFTILPLQPGLELQPDLSLTMVDCRIVLRLKWIEAL